MHKRTSIYQFALVLLFISFYTTCIVAQKPIDRKALVERHKVINTKFDSLSPLSVGNGKFAFTVDITGLQTFPLEYKKGIPLGTQSEWGWHSFIDTASYKPGEALKEYEINGRKISYAVQWNEPGRNRNAADWFRQNPHRLHLGNLGFELIKKDGSIAALNDIKNIHQQLNPWTGEIRTHFTLEEVPVNVLTFSQQQQDAISVQVNSVLVKEGRLKIFLRFPYPTGEWLDEGVNFIHDEKHLSNFKTTSSGAINRHQLDTTKYFTEFVWKGRATILQKQAHYFLITPPVNQTTFEFTCLFTPSQSPKSIPGFAETKANNYLQWRSFWTRGGAIDFSGSTDPRANELERRIVLSQYLTKIQCAGAYPPQETGLTYNSWFGKPHLEMHWWHGVHFAQWGRTELMEKSLNWYFTVAEKAKRIAKRQGFDGLRWQKMTDNEGNESPSSVGAFLIWQQPHFIYMAEMLYRSKPTKEVLNKYKDLLFATADFMASFPSYDAKTKKYNLGKGLIPAQECFDAVTTFNPTYELAYWSWALQKAQEWKQRLGLPGDKKWDEIINNLAPLPQLNNVYLATESTPDCYEPNSRYLTDHPAVLGAYSSLPAVHGLNTTVMKNTLDTVWKVWKWNDTWGWDFPLTAMTAARLHLGEKAVEAVLMPIKTNTYLINGHNYQDERLTIYLPGNGGVLNAVALMCTGADADKEINIGFPKDWKVKWEGLKKMF